MVYINMVFFLGNLVIFGGKPENCAIPDSFRELKASLIINNGNFPLILIKSL